MYNDVPTITAIPPFVKLLIDIKIIDAHVLAHTFTLPAMNAESVTIGVEEEEEEILYLTILERDAGCLESVTIGVVYSLD